MPHLTKKMKHDMPIPSEPALPPPPAGGYARYKVSDLQLDVQNPRLIEVGDGAELSEDDLVKALFERMAVEEVAMSIAHNGYFDHEPLIIEPNSSGKYTVIEGNRRLAAVRLLLDSKLRDRLKATDLPPISPERRKELQSLPAVVSNRHDVWRYLGFKHVNGPAVWGAYAKAQYIAQIHNTYGVSLAEIAAQIGDYSNTVERQYRGLMVIEQAEAEKVFDRRNISKRQFHFNYIYTALDNPNYREFLGLDSKRKATTRPVPAKNTKRLGELLTWLYGDKKQSTDSLIKSQNPDLGILGQTLTDPKAVAALRSGLPLAVAHDISLGDTNIFAKALLDAKASLQRAMGTLTTGYDGKDSDVMQTAIEVEHLGRDLVDQMRLKQKHSSRPPRQAGA